VSYELLPWLILGGAVVLVAAAYLVIRIIVRMVRFLLR